MDNQIKIAATLMQVYEILNMTSQESKVALSDLAGLQQLAINTELLKDLTKEEVEKLNKEIPAAAEEERKNQIRIIAQKRQNNAEFTLKAKTAADKVIHDHFDYLKTRGDASQKKQISNILAEVE